MFAVAGEAGIGTLRRSGVERLEVGVGGGSGERGLRLQPGYSSVGRIDMYTG